VNVFSFDLIALVPEVSPGHVASAEVPYPHIEGHFDLFLPDIIFAVACVLRVILAVLSRICLFDLGLACLASYFYST